MTDGTGETAAPDTGARGATRLVLLFIAALGLLIIALSFAPWVKFEGTVPGADVAVVSISISGTEIGRVVGDDYNQPADVADQHTNPCSCRGDKGDGHITAVLGIVVTIGALVGLAMPRLVRGATLTVAVSSLAALVVAGWNAMTTWSAVGARDLESTFVELSGQVTPALWALTTVAAATAILCGVVWALTATPAPEEKILEEEVIPEGLNGWA
jgi:hypothetical protein